MLFSIFSYFLLYYVLVKEYILFYNIFYIYLSRGKLTNLRLTWIRDDKEYQQKQKHPKIIKLKIITIIGKRKILWMIYEY